MDAGQTVMVVDDDERIRRSVAELLEMEGYTVLAAANGEDALRLLRTRPLPGLILLDVNMPVMDGWRFRDTLLKELPLASIPVVVTSGISSAYNLKGHLHSVAYLEKPFNRNQLLEAVRKYCG